MMWCDMILTCDMMWYDVMPFTALTDWIRSNRIEFDLSRYSHITLHQIRSANIHHITDTDVSARVPSSFEWLLFRCLTQSYFSAPFYCYSYSPLPLHLLYSSSNFLLSSQMCWFDWDSSLVWRQSCSSGNTKTTQVRERWERERMKGGWEGREWVWVWVSQRLGSDVSLLPVFLMHVPHEYEY